MSCLTILVVEHRKLTNCESHFIGNKMCKINILHWFVGDVLKALIFIYNLEYLSCTK